MYIYLYILFKVYLNFLTSYKCYNEQFLIHLNVHEHMYKDHEKKYDPIY